MSYVGRARWQALFTRLAHPPGTKAALMARPVSGPGGFGNINTVVAVLSRGGGGPSQPNLWVENGLIWDLANYVLAGATDYLSLSNFFTQAQTGFGYGVQAAPTSWYADTPFSASDIPILNWPPIGQSGSIFMVWPSLTSLSFAPSFLAKLPVSVYPDWLLNTTAAPYLSITLAQSFQASSPQGQGTFQAKYVLFTPNGASKDPYAGPISGQTYPAWQVEFADYGWWYS